MRHILRIAASSFLVLFAGNSALTGCGSPVDDHLFGLASGVTTDASVGAGNGTTTTASGVGGATTSSTSSMSTTSTTASSEPMSQTVGSGGSARNSVGTTSTSVAASSSTGGLPAEVGCSDGTREAYPDTMKEPNIAGCAGAFAIAGVTTPSSAMPQCMRQSGNDGVNQMGTGCSAADLCADGWHVCEGAADVASSASTGECPPIDAAATVFWLTRQVEDISGNCVRGPATNNLTGCGTLGQPLIAAQTGTCVPLTRFMRAVDCEPTTTWYCGNQEESPNQTILDEAEIVQHGGNGEGGVLCCKG